jgi:hypothetical protein
MTAIFVSHRSSDNAEAQALKDWLGQQGHEQLLLEFDLTMGSRRAWTGSTGSISSCGVPGPADRAPAVAGVEMLRHELAIGREKGRAVFVVRIKPRADIPLTPALEVGNVVHVQRRD